MFDNNRTANVYRGLFYLTSNFELAKYFSIRVIYLSRSEKLWKTSSKVKNKIYDFFVQSLYYSTIHTTYFLTIIIIVLQMFIEIRFMEF